MAGKRQVMLSDRKIQVERPRLRTKGEAEKRSRSRLHCHANPRAGERMLDTLLCGVSTRNYKD